MPYKSFLVPLLIILISQVLKLATDAVKGNLNLKNIFESHGGMPSSHTAAVTSISTIVALTHGIDSVLFAVVLIFSIIVIRDATGLRMITEHQSLAINKIIKGLPAEKQTSINLQRESVGHTYLEILGGVVLGVALTLILF